MHDHSFDDCDVYVYEYSSPLLSNSYSPNEVAETMRYVFTSDDVLKHDSIIFLTHSLGGVIARDFLTKYREAAKRVKFVYFFAAPTTGSDVARLGKASKNPQFHKLVTMTSASYLADLQRNWLAANFTFPSYCAYEKQNINLGFKIVDQQSASNLCSQHLDPINANHFDIVKPEGTRSPPYQAFLGAFKEVMGTNGVGPPLPVPPRVVQPTPRRGTEVLVADFDGPDPKRYRVTETLLNQLKQATKGLPDFSVDALGKPITEQQGARIALKEGRDHQATVVIWGWYGRGDDKSVVTTHFQLTRPSRYVPLTSDTQDVRVPTADLENFTLQYRLSADAVAFTEATLGLLRFEKGDYAVAVSHLTRALTNDSLPTSVIQRSSLLFYRGTAHQELGRWDDALSDLSAVIAADPNQWPAYLNRGNGYQRNGEVEKAMVDYDRALVLAPKNPQVHYARGLAFDKQNRHAEAISEYDSAIKFNPKYAKAYGDRGFAHSEMGHIDAALQDYKKALSLDPKLAYVYNDRSAIWVARGDFAMAIVDAEEALRLDPRYSNAHNNRGSALLGQGKKIEAMAEFDRAIDLDARNGGAYANRAILQKREDLALADLDKALSLGVDDPRGLYQAYYNRGNIHLRAKRFTEAISDFTEAIRLNPRYSEAFNNRSVAYLKIDRLQEALSDGEQAVRLNPVASAYNNRGNVRDRLQDYAGALSDFNEALRLEPNNLDALFNRAAAFGMSGQWQRSIEDIERYIDSKPSAADGYNIRGLAHRGKGERESALSDFNLAIAIDSSVPDYYMNRGETLFAIGRELEAVPDFQRVLELSDDPTMSRNASLSLWSIRENQRR